MFIQLFTIPRQWNWTTVMGEMQRCYAIYVSLNEFWNIAFFYLERVIVRDRYLTLRKIQFNCCHIFDPVSTPDIWHVFHRQDEQLFSPINNIFPPKWTFFAFNLKIYHQTDLVFKTNIRCAYAKSNFVLGRWHRTGKQQGSLVKTSFGISFYNCDVQSLQYDASKLQNN